MKITFLFALAMAVLFALPTFAQEQPKPNLDDLYQKVFAGVGLDLDKFPADQQAKLKTLILQCIAAGQSQGKIEGYKQGMDDSIQITKKLLNDFVVIRKDQIDALFQQKSKPSRLERIGAAMTAFSEGFNRAAQQQRQTWITTNCTSSHIGSYVYTNCSSTGR